MRSTASSSHDDAVGVPAVGDRGRPVPVRAVVGEGRVRAELLEAVAAVGAVVVGRDHAADADEVADLELVDAAADLRHPPDDLVARDARVDGRHHVVPLVAGRVQVRVADAAEEDLDLDVPVGHVAPGDGGPGQGGGRARGGERFGFGHGSSPSWPRGDEPRCGVGPGCRISGGSGPRRRPRRRPDSFKAVTTRRKRNVPPDFWPNSPDHPRRLSIDDAGT